MKKLFSNSGQLFHHLTITFIKNVIDLTNQAVLYTASRDDHPITTDGYDHDSFFFNEIHDFLCLTEVE